MHAGAHTPLGVIACVHSSPGLQSAAAIHTTLAALPPPPCSYIMLNRMSVAVKDSQACLERAGSGPNAPCIKKGNIGTKLACPSVGSWEE